MKGASSILTALVLATEMAFLIKLIAGSQTKGNLRGKRMVRALYCPSQVLKDAHRYRTVRGGSKIQCVAQCQQDSQCQAIIYDGFTKSCSLANAKAAQDCSNMDTDSSGGLTFYQEPPPCGTGEELGVMGLCVCASGFTGNPCERYFNDCYDLFTHDSGKKDGVYTVRPLKASKPFEVFCRRVSSVRTYILDRRRTEENFDRPYADYRAGFGKVGPGDSDHWIGLENVYALTADRPQQLRVNLKIFNNNYTVLIYEQFQLSDEASGYKLHFNVSMLNRTKDCLKPLVNAKFSTYDNDKDRVKNYNCARESKGGFWFYGTGCSKCNPFGVLYQPSNGWRVGKKDEAYWTDALGNRALFKVSMFLLPYVN